MKFEWDEKKANSNKSKHGIDFNLAVTAFDDPFALVERDEKHSTSEEIREVLIGESDEGVLVVIFTIRMNKAIYRIISARKASQKERKLYEEAKRIPL
jgi:uncharacterized DUF497 family protein